MRSSFPDVKSPRIVAVFLFASFVLLGLACSGGGAGPSAGGTIKLQGAGATFPMPLYQKWISEYGKLHPNVLIDYQSIGSGGGIKQIQAQTVDFGASDAPMTDAELKASPGEIVHIPAVLGAVVVTYNVPSITQPLNLSAEVVADIFLGKIKKWDDPRLKHDNPSANLPATDLTVVHRSDGSGTTFVFTDYLSKVSPEWKEKVGTDKSPKWPVGQGGKGNEGVTGQIKQQPNTIGYVELAYAVQNKLPVALIKNASGKFIEASIDAVTAAAASASAQTPEDLRVSITNSTGGMVTPSPATPTFLLTRNKRAPTRERPWLIISGGAFTTASNLRKTYSMRRCRKRSLSERKQRLLP